MQKCSWLSVFSSVALGLRPANRSRRRPRTLSFAAAQTNVRPSTSTKLALKYRRYSRTHPNGGFAASLRTANSCGAGPPVHRSPRPHDGDETLYDQDRERQHRDGSARPKLGRRCGRSCAFSNGQPPPPHDGARAAVRKRGHDKVRWVTASVGQLRLREVAQAGPPTTRSRWLVVDRRSSRRRPNPRLADVP